MHFNLMQTNKSVISCVFCGYFDDVFTFFCSDDHNFRAGEGEMDCCSFCGTRYCWMIGGSELQNEKFPKYNKSVIVIPSFRQKQLTWTCPSCTAKYCSFKCMNVSSLIFGNVIFDLSLSRKSFSILQADKAEHREICASSEASSKKTFTSK